MVGKGSNPVLVNERSGGRYRDGTHSDMDGVTQGPEGCFLNAFAQCRMSEGRAGDILEPSTHLKGQAERRRQFRYPRADGLNAEQKMIIGASDHANEACIASQRQRATVRPERKDRS